MNRPDIPLRRVAPEPRDELPATWRQARPARIAESLERALSRDPGGWYVVGQSSDVRTTSVTRTIAGREIVLWRAEDGSLRAGPGACPHMGALLHGCEVTAGQVRCRWHGMALDESAGPSWSTMPALDDGVLLWARLDTPGETPSDTPRLPARPDVSRSLVGVVAQSAVCEPRDIIANRLDPWHGTWFHPYAFSHLQVDESLSGPERLVLDVTFQVTGGIGVPVTADFTCPDARTIVMTILRGEGEGSIVETHATPLGTDALGRPATMMTEATIAWSPRRGFGLARLARPLVQAAMRRVAGQLWVDDLAYAERLWQLRARKGTHRRVPHN